MKIVTLTVGYINENCYLIYDEKSNETVIIDPGDEAEKIYNVVTELNLSLNGIFLTHGHFDHILAVPFLKAKTGTPVYIHHADAEYLSNPRLSHAPLTILESMPKIDKLLQENDIFNFAGFSIKVLHTPGHTPGSCCYIAEDCMFSGDTIFSGDIGRTDLLGGDDTKMQKSIGKIKSLTGDYKIYPGHDKSTTLEIEKKMNPYF